MRIAGVLLLLAAIGWAGENPSEAYERIRRMNRRLTPAEKEAQKKEAIRFLASWEKEGEAKSAGERTDLASLYSLVGRHADAMALLEAIVFDEATDAETRKRAANRWGLLLTLQARDLPPPVRKGAIGATARFLETYGPASDERTRSTLARARGFLLHIDGDTDGAVQAFFDLANERPMFGSVAADFTRMAMIAGVWRMEDYPALEKRLQERIDALKEGFAATRGASRAVAVNPGVFDRMFDRAMAPVRLLGKPVPAWTEIARLQGDPATEGKVTLLYFMLNADASSVRSLPALRGLQKKHEELSIVLLVLPSTRVYRSRVELDADVDASGEEPPPVTLSRLTRNTPLEEQLREGEKEAHVAFLKAHELAWPAALIDRRDMGRKFGASTSLFPNLVLLDRRGRLRSIHAGPLERGSPIVDERLSGAIAGLLAEKE
ncbi:MAG: hypothetical protein AAGD14_09300 [Planctomycetota bacterium]